MKLTKLHILIIVRLYKYLYGVDLAKTVTCFINQFEGLRKKSGLSFAIKYFKVVKLHFTRYACGKPLLVNNSRVSLTRGGVPSKFLYLKDLIDSGHIRVVLSILTYTRAIKPNRREDMKLEPDFSTITDPFKRKRIWTIPTTFVRKFVFDNHLHLALPVYSDTDHYISSKSSPTGPATASSIKGVRTLSPNQLSWIYRIINPEYHDRINKIICLAFMGSNFLDPGSTDQGLGYSGKLAIIKDPELKLRVIAMEDYLSQFTLRPIHDGLLSLLRNKLTQDRTFTQNPFNNWTLDAVSHSYYSLDLSAATDRFPVILQKKLLSCIYKNNDFAFAWMNLLQNREFTYKDKQPMKYTVGQPMGAYSSWAAFTITHHLVVAYAAHLCNISNFKDYILLGDDIVIKNDKVARKYISLMTKLGVDISLTKTHISKNMYEFAKRWIRDNKELTGIPLRGILLNWKSPSVVYLELLGYIQRVPCSSFSVLDLCCKLYDMLPYQHKRCKSFVDMRHYLYNFNHGIRWTYNLVTYDELRSFINNKIKEVILVPPTFKECPEFLRGLFRVGLVREAMSSKDSVEKGLETINERLKSFKEKFPNYYQLMSSYPLLLAYINKLREICKKLESYDSCDLHLEDLLNSLQYEDFDALVMNLRRKSRVQTVVPKLWVKPFRVFRDEAKYAEMGSSMGFAIKNQSDFLIRSILGQLAAISKNYEEVNPKD
jgi:hypothetical protein